MRAAASATGSWPSHGADLANRRSQPHPEGVRAGTVSRLRERWAARLSGYTRGAVAPPYVTSTPAVVGGVAYYGDWRGNVFARDVRTGRLRWRHRATEFSADGLLYDQVNSSPAVSGGSVYVSTGEGTVVALSRRNGRIQWKTVVDATFGSLLYSSPAVADGTVVIGVSSIQVTQDRPTFDFRGSVVGLNARTGSIRWRTWVMRPGLDGFGGSVWSSPAIDPQRGLAFIGTGQAYAEPAGPRTDALMALRIRDGRIHWTRQFTRDDVFTLFKRVGPDYDIGASPNLFRVGRRDVVGVGDKAGRYAVLTRDGGRTVWRRSLCPGSHVGGIMTTAAVARGTIWLACNRMRDELELGSHRNESDVLSLRASDGRVLLRRRVAGATVGAVSEAGGAVFVPNADGTLRAWSANTGRRLWSTRPGGPLGGGVTVAGDRVLVGYGFAFFVAPTADAAGGLVAYSTQTNEG